MSNVIDLTNVDNSDEVTNLPASTRAEAIDLTGEDDGRDTAAARAIAELGQLTGKCYASIHVLAC